MKCGLILPGLAVGLVVCTARIIVFRPGPLARGTDSGSDLQTLQVNNIVEASPDEARTHYQQSLHTAIGPIRAHSSLAEFPATSPEILSVDLAKIQILGGRVCGLMSGLWVGVGCVPLWQLSSVHTHWLEEIAEALMPNPVGEQNIKMWSRLKSAHASASQPWNPNTRMWYTCTGRSYPAAKHSV